MSDDGLPRMADIRGLHARMDRLEKSMKEALNKKVDSNLAEVGFEQLRALSERKECHQEATIAVLSASTDSIKSSVQRIEGSLGRWKTIKLGGVLALVLAVVSGAAYMVRVDSKTDSVSVAVKRIEKEVNSMGEKFTDQKMVAAFRQAIQEELKE